MGRVLARQERPVVQPWNFATSGRAELLARIGRAVAEPGRRLLLTGEPGAGRTAILEQAAHAARTRGTQVLHVRCRPQDAGRRFVGLAALLAGVDDDHLDHLVPVQRSALEDALGDRPTNRSRPLRSSLTLHVALTAVFDRLLGTGPVLLVVDDWPWLDAGTDEALRYVMERPTHQLRQVSLLAGQQRRHLLTGRPDLVDGRVFRPTAVLPVPALEPAVLGGVVTARAGRVLTPAELTDLHAATGGNPGWALELLAARDAVAEDPEDPDDPRRLVPPSVGPALAARLGDLPPPALDVLRAVAAAGRAAPATLAVLLPDSGRGVVDALEHAVVELDGDVLRPAHPVLANAALATLDRSGRRRLHAHLATAVPDPAARAHHLDAATAPGTDAGLAATLSAASSWARTPAVALDLAERAVARSDPDDPDRGARVLALARAALEAGRTGRASCVLRDLDWEGIELPLFDRGVALLTRVLLARGSRALVQEHLEELGRRLHHDPVRVAVLLAHRAQTAGAPTAEGLQALAVLLGPPHTLAAQHRALAGLVRDGVRGGRGLDLALLARSEALEAQGLLVARQDGARAQWATLAPLVGDVLGARTALTGLHQEAVRAGDHDAVAVFQTHLAAVHVLTGSPTAARELLTAVVRGPHRDAVPPVTLLRARSLLALARDDGGEFSRLLVVPPGERGDDLARVLRTALPGLRAARSERWADAVEPLLAARSLADRTGVREPGCRMWLDVELGETLVALDRWQEAEEVATRFAEPADGGSRPLAHAHELRLRGLLAAARRDLAQAQDALTASVDLLPPDAHPLERGRSLLHLSRVLRQRRARARSHEVLAQARELAVRLDDAPLLARVHREAPGGAAGEDGPALTPSELAVALAVAAGATNREVAQAQFLSVRTVESHLSRVFRKVGVSSRTQLAARLHDRVGSTT